MQRRSQKTHFAYHKHVLFCLIFILIGIFIYRTTTYFKQVEIQSNYATLFNKPDIESKELADLPKGTRLTVLRSKYHWYYVKTQNKQFGWIADWILPQQHKRTITNLADATIVIDAGHGGNDVGALSNSGKYEKKYTLRYSMALAQKLERLGAKVYLTRDDDSYVGLGTRPALAEKVHADAFISFHFDSAPVANSATGFTTYYYHKNNGSYALAEAINSSFSKLYLDNRGIEFGNFLVIRENSVPSVLLEMGYINSNRDFSEISNSAYQNQVITDVTSGLIKYFKNQDTQQ